MQKSGGMAPERARHGANGQSGVDGNGIAAPWRWAAGRKVPQFGDSRDAAAAMELRASSAHHPCRGARRGADRGAVGYISSRLPTTANRRLCCECMYTPVLQAAASCHAALLALRALPRSTRTASTAQLHAGRAELLCFFHSTPCSVLLHCICCLTQTSCMEMDA